MWKNNGTQASHTFLALMFWVFSVSGKIQLTRQKQRWEVKPEGSEKAAIQEDAFGALCRAVFQVSPLKVHATTPFPLNLFSCKMYLWKSKMKSFDCTQCPCIPTLNNIVVKASIAHMCMWPFPHVTSGFMDLLSLTTCCSLSHQSGLKMSHSNPTLIKLHLPPCCSLCIPSSIPMYPSCVLL